VAASVALYAAFCVPVGKDVVVTLGDDLAVTVKLRAWVAVTERESVTRTVKLLVPEPVGVPEIAPVLEASASPVGSVPEVTDQL
jgi:hypothetical protein